MTEEPIRFSGDGLEFEGILHLPQTKEPYPAVAVCHPHPLYGGDMHNNVVLAICHALVEASIAALRFNFRGVGRSSGSFSDGIGEQEDVKAALSFLTSINNIKSDKLGLAGYSFGTIVALPVTLNSDIVKAVALVSPFIIDSDWEQLKNSSKPKLFICGGNDLFPPSQEAQRRISELPEPNQLEIIQKADHFWWGYEKEIADRISDFFTCLKE